MGIIETWEPAGRRMLQIDYHDCYSCMAFELMPLARVALNIRGEQFHTGVNPV